MTIEQLDLRQFQQHLGAARDGVDPGENWRDGLGVWPGSALSGVDGSVIAAAALMLDESRVDALQRHAALALTSDEAGQVISDLQHLLADHPLRETLRGHLMVALCRSGRQAEALGVFEEGRCLLRDVRRSTRLRFWTPYCGRLGSPEIRSRTTWPPALPSGSRA